jgi:hypothetical protein
MQRGLCGALLRYPDGNIDHGPSEVVGELPGLETTLETLTVQFTFTST